MISRKHLFSMKQTRQDLPEVAHSDWQGKNEGPADKYPVIKHF